MKRFSLKPILIVSVLILGVYLLMPALQLMAQQTGSTQPGQPSEPMSAEEVDSRLAAMSDEEVRQAYAEKLKQDAAQFVQNQAVPCLAFDWSVHIRR